MSPFHLFLILTNLQVILSSKVFEKFQKALEDAKGDLRWIRAVTGHEFDYLTDDVHRHKRSTSPLENLLANFNAVNGFAENDMPELIDDIDSGDAWYSNFRSKECKNGGCIERTFKYSQEQKKKRKRGRRTKGKSVRKFPSANTIPKPADMEDEDEYPENISTHKDKNDPDYDDYDNVKDTIVKSDKQIHHNKFDIGAESKPINEYEKDKYAKNTDDSINNKMPNVDQAHEVNYDSIFDNIQQPARGSSQGERIELKDQIEQTKNDLSHEADYKLSKIEQEAMEKKIRPNREWPLKHPEYQLPLLMQKQELGLSNVASKNYRSSQKRSVDPMAEVRLKVSSRLMEKGLGASLPSDALEDPGIISDASHEFEKSDENENKELTGEYQNSLWMRSAEDMKKENNLHRELRRNKRQTAEEGNEEATSRKLMTISDYDSIDTTGIEDGNIDNKDMQVAQYSNENSPKAERLNSKSSSDYDSDLQSDNIDIGGNNQKENQEKLTKDEDPLSIDFSEALLKGSDTASCNSCGDSSKLLKVGSKLQNSTSQNNQTCKDTVNAGNVVTINKSQPSTTPKENLSVNSSISCNSNSNSNKNSDSPAKSNSNLNSNLNSVSNANQVSLKFDVAFNATVMNGTQKSDSRNSCSNHSKKRKQSKYAGGSDGSKLLMINKRGIIFPPLPAWVTKRTDEVVSRSIDKTAEDSGLGCLLSGKLTAQLVNAVFRLVEGNKGFRRHILPGLRNHKVKACMGCNNLNSLKTEQNCDQIDRSEQMLRQVMETISAIIEQQVRSRTCIPLCTALRNFYDTILASRTENQKKVRSTRYRKATEQMENHKTLTKREISNEPVVRQKYSVVKKLLNQYSYLPNEEQEKVKDAKDMLQVHLTYLDELDRTKKRRRRELAQDIFQPIDLEAREVQNDMSPQFVKLVKTAEMMRKARSDDGPDFDFLQDDDYY